MQVRGNYLFNMNASYGIGARMKADFPELKDLLAHMDRLGIDGAAVFNVSGRDFQTLPANRQLIEDIENTPGAKERLLPVFCVNPQMYYDKNERQYLVDMVSSGRVRALTVFFGAYGVNLREFERILNELRPYKLIVTVDHGDFYQRSDHRDLSDLAAGFSDMFFIMRNMFWSEEQHLSDLMWRHDNIGFETSWLHTSFGLPLFVENFGPGRVFFGADTKNQQGSSIACLEYAEINEEAYDLISGGNAKRLLKEASNADIIFSQKFPPAKLNNSFWKPFIERKGLRGEYVVDAHGHSGAFMTAFMTPNFDEGQSFAYMSGHMEKMGVDKMVASAMGGIRGDFVRYNRLAREGVKPYEGKFAGYYSVNGHQPEYITEEFFEQEFAGGYFAGFKIHPPTCGISPDNPVFAPMFSFADRYRMPVQIHCWGGWLGAPHTIEPIVGKYPNMAFILGHGGGDDGGRRAAEDLAKKYPNVYLELCGSFCTLTRQLEDTVREIGADRVVFGSDAYGHDIAYELGSLLSHDLTDEELRLIFGGNMKRILDGVTLKNPKL